MDGEIRMTERGLAAGLVLLGLSPGRLRAGEVRGDGLPPAADRLIQNLVDTGSTIDAVAFTPDGDGWVVLFDGNGIRKGGKIPADAERTIRDLLDKGRTIKGVGFGPGGAW